MAQDADHHDRDGLGEVERAPRGSQDLLRVPDVGVDVVGGSQRVAGQQGPGVDQDQRVIVDVDDPGLGRDALCQLVGVVGRRQAGPEVEELPDTGLAGQEPDGPAEESAAGLGEITDLRELAEHRVGGVAVGGEIVLAAEQVIPDPGTVRHADVQPGMQIRIRTARHPNAFPRGVRPSNVTRRVKA
jgi:hypothetical protein